MPARVFPQHSMPKCACAARRVHITRTMQCVCTCAAWHVRTCIHYTMCVWTIFLMRYNVFVCSRPHVGRLVERLFFRTLWACPGPIPYTKDVLRQSLSRHAPDIHRLPQCACVFGKPTCAGTVMCSPHLHQVLPQCACTLAQKHVGARAVISWQLGAPFIPFSLMHFHVLQHHINHHQTTCTIIKY